MNDLVRDFDKGWTGGLPETKCGHGSTMGATKRQRNWIPAIIEGYFIDSIADIGAGDLNWIKDTHIPSFVSYQAYDLVPRLPEVIRFDLVKEVPPPSDLIMCLWVLNHLPYDECAAAIDNIKKSGARFLMMTDRPSCHENQPKEINMPFLERLILNEKEDSIVFIDLEAI